MASTLADQSSSLITRSDQHDNTPNDDKQPHKKGSKNKRTKTGCMTCRKRRIKCDETHPECNNCRKSKRVCTGYQPYTFKQPAGIVKDSFYGNTGRKHGQAGGSNARAQNVRSGALPPILPRPSGVSLDQHRPDFRVASSAHAFAPSQSTIHGVTSQAARHGTVAGAIRSVPGRLFANPLRTPQSSGHTEPLSYSGTNPPTGLSSSHDIQQNTQRGRYRITPVEPVKSAEEQDEGNHSEFDESLGESDYEMEDSGHQTTTTIMPTSHRNRAGADNTGGVASTASRAVFPYMDYPRDSKVRIEGMSTMFNHFIRITGPTITLYERHPNPVNNKLDSDGKPVVPDGRHFWSYTLPSLSLHHHGLLHAMLALANVQVANLQDIYPTVAMKHYHLAIHRLGENIISPTRKTHIATLATALLLAYFEVWTSDHSKWCKHLLGARLILLDIPLRRMSKFCWYSRASQRLPADSGLDVNLLNKITGLRVDYETGDARPAYPGPSIQELMTYENYADLYWWYCKMDVYQSILSGRPLMMEYPAWTQCPPRACVNMANDVYGSYDHLVLLLGRVANFTVRDKKRKTEAWRLKRKQPPTCKESPNQYPGILPTTGYIPIPTGFAGPRRRAPQRNEGLAEFETFEEASAQWDEIKEAFSFLKSKLWSKDFKPLGPEFTDNKHSPFGGVIQHSSFAISGFWMNYYMGLICLQRSHPSMPPAPLEAVGMAAKDTAKWASKIARISAGMLEVTSCADVNTISAASLVESSFCLFVAGVQFQNADERHWLVKRMDDTSRLTGFLSARNIADGCETGWQKADTIRQVPVYEKRQDRKQGGSQIRRRSRQAIEQRPAPTSETLMLESADQAFYALGLISVTEDLERVILTDAPPNLDS